ncbi:MAG: cysteine--tRNA ligase [Firmicutes bacterium]|jgi:cysteinyl-tRNA synthetase|nr:cysteine--tRNA ligase [Bacillota bacterium]
MKLFNSLTRKKEEFKTIEENKVRMYVCGPTVYNYFHIGNARPFMMFDVLRRYLEFKGYEVNYVQNFTDVDDKIINRANEEGISSLEVSEKYIEEYFKDADALGIKRATVHPKVTENIEGIIKFIDVLINRGYAYEVSGDVYFDTKAFENYGKLSGQSIEDLNVGARIDVNTDKKNPTDFVLWKSHKPGEPYWVSPWGNGRPGWHIECSVMSNRYLGDSIDIHAGGQDLIFPHHENEIAQTEAYTGKKFANYWVHNGYININNEKMSKSKGNFFTVREILEKYPAEVVRFFMLSAHYRNPVNFSEELVEQAKNGLERIYKSKENMEYLMENATSEKMTEDEKARLEELREFKTKFITAMDDDLNTADGVSVIFELVREINISSNEESSKEFLQGELDSLRELTEVLGILTAKKESLDDEIEALIKQRQDARANRDFKLADQIRDDLSARGIILEDTSQGVKWRFKK